MAPGIAVGFRLLLHSCSSHHGAGVGGRSECGDRLTSSWCSPRYSAAATEELVQPHVVGSGDKFHIRHISCACVPVKSVHEPGFLYQADARWVRYLDIAEN